MRLRILYLCHRFPYPSKRGGKPAVQHDPRPARAGTPVIVGCWHDRRTRQGRLAASRRTETFHIGRVAEGGVELVVMAPVPWSSSTNPRFGTARFAATPESETRNGIEMLRPRYRLMPKVGMTLAPSLLATACPGRCVRWSSKASISTRSVHTTSIPGLAAAWLGQQPGKRVAITARGSDLNLIGRFPPQCKMMTGATRQSAAPIGFCHALVDAANGWGVSPERLHVMRSSADLCRFAPQPRTALLERLGIVGMPHYNARSPTQRRANAYAAAWQVSAGKRPAGSSVRCFAG